MNCNQMEGVHFLTIDGKRYTLLLIRAGMESNGMTWDQMEWDGIIHLSQITTSLPWETPAGKDLCRSPDPGRVPRVPEAAGPSPSSQKKAHTKKEHTEMDCKYYAKRNIFSTFDIFFMKNQNQEYFTLSKVTRNKQNNTIQGKIHYHPRHPQLTVRKIKKWPHATLFSSTQRTRNLTPSPVSLTPSKACLPWIYSSNDTGLHDI